MSKINLIIKSVVEVFKRTSCIVSAQKDSCIALLFLLMLTLVCRKLMTFVLLQVSCVSLITQHVHGKQVQE